MAVGIVAVGIKKYNPGFLTDDEIVASFCVRTGEFDALLECLRASTGQSNAHALVIGPRGSGKTHLLLRVAAEARHDASLAGFYPIVFAEESYEISTIGEFWLECLGRLAGQAPDDERADLRLSYDDLRTTGNDRDLADRCLGSVLDFADRHGKRVVLLVENLNMLFSDMVDPDAGWRLRHTLQNEPRIILLGSATSRFEEIDHPEHALYDLFRVVTLRPLNIDECAALWTRIAGQSAIEQAVRPLQILTGGNPRLLAIIARFGAGRSFRELMNNLLDLVDDHTEYFKSHLESLPAQERRVYLALARLWRPATAREVADQSRLDTNICSALLKRLVDRGAVVIEGGTPRRRQYYLTERLYNIYYLLRRGGESNHVVKALIDFMVCLYSPDEFWDIVKSIYEEARDTGAQAPRVAEPTAAVWISKGDDLDQSGRWDESLDAYGQVIHRLGADGIPPVDPALAVALEHRSAAFEKLGREDEAIADCDELVRRFGTSGDDGFPTVTAMALHRKGMILGKGRDWARALDSFEQALSRLNGSRTLPDHVLEARVIQGKGLALIMNARNQEAIACFDEVIERFGVDAKPEFAHALANSLIGKMLVLGLDKRTITEHEFSLLLRCMAWHDTLPHGSVMAIMAFIARTGAERALQLIQTSPSVTALLPLLTALQQEVGGPIAVSREIEEVARDIRLKLANARSSVTTNPD